MTSAGARELVQVLAKLARRRYPQQFSRLLRPYLNLFPVVPSPREFPDIGGAHRRVADKDHCRRHGRPGGPDEFLL
jgi:hypothetical protein